MLINSVCSSAESLKKETLRGKNVSSGWYVGDSRNATLNSLLGRGVDISGDAGAVGVGVWGSLRDNNRPAWVGATVGIGPGVGGSAGYGNTRIVPIRGFQK